MLGDVLFDLDGRRERPMPQDLPTHEPPIYFANLVTTILNVDELTMEFRRYISSHMDLLKTPSQQVKLIPPPSPQEITQLEPVARVVLTFTAAKALKQQLDQVFPQIEQQRKTE